MRTWIIAAVAAGFGAAAVAWAQTPGGGAGCDLRTVSELRDIREQAVKITERLLFLVPDPELQFRNLPRR